MGSNITIHGRWRGLQPGTYSAMGPAMRNQFTLLVIGISGISALMIVTTVAQDQPVQPRKIEITAKKYEFDVPRIEVRVGEPVELMLSSVDAKHGFECKDLGIAKVTFEKDKPATVTFTATKPGTYEFKCANFCGLGHGRMKGQIIVQP
jgi:cytochrome c oxidase subunit 2